jgi:ubiquinone/menaquinone biosynthesis C-methylase UbiE
MNVALGKAETLPFPDASFNCLLMVTSICFVDDLDRSCSEAYRVLRDDGTIVIGFINKDSHLGRQYQDEKDGSHFYKAATFFSTEEVVDHLKQAGFKGFSFRQTLFSKDVPQDVLEGCDKGAFIAIRGRK